MITEELETQWIVWHTDKEGHTEATLKRTQIAAKQAYNKLSKNSQDYKEYGFSYANSAYPTERVAAGLIPFPKINVPL